MIKRLKLSPKSKSKSPTKRIPMITEYLKAISSNVVQEPIENKDNIESLEIEKTELRKSRNPSGEKSKGRRK